MDYALINDALIGDQVDVVNQCFTEDVLPVHVPTLGHRLPDALELVSPLEELPEDGIIRIAVPSVAQKLSAGFIHCLHELEKACPDKVHFVFFLGEKSLQAVASLRQLRRELGHAEFHADLAYPAYIREINRCQLHACSFPFGGTNSLVDSLRQGVPILALEGIEPHARVDASFVRRVGLPETFVCNTPEAFTRRLIELVEHPHELLRWKKHLLEGVDVDALLVKGNDGPDAYRQTIHALLERKLS
jgi:hypothetical protein